MTHRGRSRIRFSSLAPAATACCAFALTGCGSPAPASWNGPIPYELLGVATIPTTHPMTGGKVGGLSGLAYDPVAQSWLVVSDREPDPVAYTLRTSFDPRPESEGRAWVAGNFEAWLGREWPVPPVSADAEGVAIRRTATDVHERVWVYEKGPAVAVEDMRSAEVRTLEIPDEVLSHYRYNLALEAAAVVPDRLGDEIWVGMESSLTIDGPESTRERGGVSRVLVYRADTGELLRTVGYRSDPLPADWDQPGDGDSEGQAGMNTLVGLSSLPDSTVREPRLLLALERAYRPGSPNRGRVYALDGSTSQDDGFGRPVLTKRLAFDFDDLDLVRWNMEHPDNVEGIAIGPPISDRRGGRLVLVVVDDNLGRFDQVQYIYALRVRFAR